MSTARSLHRRLDPDAIARVLNKTPQPPAPVKRQKPPRPAESYRAARRNIIFDARQVWGPRCYIHAGGIPGMSWST